jgi:hypothetical protein
VDKTNLREMDGLGRHGGISGGSSLAKVASFIWLKFPRIPNYSQAYLEVITVFTIYYLFNFHKIHIKSSVYRLQMST